MSARSSLLALAVGGVIVASSCSTLVPDSSPGSTLPPLPTRGPGSTVLGPDEVVSPTDASPEPTSSSTTVDSSTTTIPATSTTTTSPPTTTTPTTTVPRGGDLVDGVRATIGGRTLQFSASCRDGDAVTLDGVTWAFAGNSFRFSGGDDERSEAELLGDGWTMPMLVASVQSGVYTYVGTAVAGSVSSAEVVIDHGALDSC